MTLKVIPRLQAFLSAIRRTFVQHFTRFQLTACSMLAELLVNLETVLASDSVFVLDCCARYKCTSMYVGYV